MVALKYMQVSLTCKCMQVSTMQVSTSPFCKGFLIERWLAEDEVHVYVCRFRRSFTTCHIFQISTTVKCLFVQVSKFGRTISSSDIISMVMRGL